MAIRIDISKLYWIFNQDGSLTCHSSPYDRIQEWLLVRGVKSFDLETGFNYDLFKGEKFLVMDDVYTDVAIEFKLTWL